MITTREITSYVGSFKPYKLYELSKKASCDLLEYKISSEVNITLSEKEELAELTGGVPLALEIICSLLLFPDLANPAAVISELKKEPILTLSPKQLPRHSTIDASFSLSYKYLSNEEKKIGQLLSNFPGSFNSKAYLAITMNVFNLSEDIIKAAVTTLVQRSLLEYSHDDDQYHFHSLIREYFLKKQKPERLDLFRRTFNNYFLHLLSEAYKAYNSQNFKTSLATLDKERHNFLQLFKYLEDGRVSNLKFTANIILDTIKGKFLICKFSYKDLLQVLKSLMAYLKNRMDKLYLHSFYYAIYYQGKMNSSKAAIKFFEDNNGRDFLAATYMRGSFMWIRTLVMVSEFCSILGQHENATYYYGYAVSAQIKTV